MPLLSEQKGTRDALLQTRAEQVLCGSPYADLRRLTCEVHEGVLVLSGTTPTYFLKQLAQSLLTRSLELHRLINCVRVVSARQRAESWIPEGGEETVRD